jgi:hypothetical protein
MNERDEAPITCCPPGKCAVEEAGSGPACPRKVGFHARASAAPQEPPHKYAVDPIRADESLALAEKIMDRVVATGSAYLKLELVDPTAPQPQAAPQEPEPDPSDELAWYKWAHKELGRRNVKLAEENFQYWQKERAATPQPQAPSSDDVRDRRIAELEEHLTQAIMGRQFHYERAEKAEVALADARNSALEEAAAAMDATCVSGKAQHSDMIRALRTNSEK